MGTTLTGTTPQDTYDSLIKVTDNGPLDPTTAKYLSDGLGNDSPLALSTANVGIGTNSPNAYSNLTTLTINGTNGSVLDFEVGSTLFGEIFAESNSLKVDATGASGTLKLLTNTVERMRIDSSGNVGIGTSAPEALLHVNKSTAGGEGGYIYLDNPAASTLSSNVGIKFGTSGGASFSAVYTGLIQNIVTDGSTGASDLVFGTFDGAASAERVRISAAGKVGIGNSIPSSFLSNGNQLVVGSGAADQGMTIYSIAGGTGNLFFADGTTGDEAYRGFLRYNHADDSMQIYTAGANQRMHIDSSGLVGIGTSTPSAFAVLSLAKNGVDAYSALNIVNSSSTANLFVGVGGSAVFNTALRNNAYILNASASDLILGTSDTERCRILAAGGLTFNGDTAAANALDDYEEGTFTPTFDPASGAYDTLTYGTTNGKYTKIGNRVDFSLRVTITAYSAGSASGLLRLAGLPYACVGTYVGSVSMSLVDDFAADRYPIKGFVNDTTTYILLRYMTALNTNEGYVSATDITASSTIRISGTYFTA